MGTSQQQVKGRSTYQHYFRLQHAAGSLSPTSRGPISTCTCQQMSSGPRGNLGLPHSELAAMSSHFLETPGSTLSPGQYMVLMRGSRWEKASFTRSRAWNGARVSGRGFSLSFQVSVPCGEIKMYSLQMD